MPLAALPVNVKNANKWQIKCYQKFCSGVTLENFRSLALLSKSAVASSPCGSRKGCTNDTKSETFWAVWHLHHAVTCCCDFATNHKLLYWPISCTWLGTVKSHISSQQQAAATTQEDSVWPVASLIWLERPEPLAASSERSSTEQLAEQTVLSFL